MSLEERVSPVASDQGGFRCLSWSRIGGYENMAFTVGARYEPQKY
jgi:hypothetical protein